MTWLVLCSAHDEAALWASDGLRDLEGHHVELVTDADLVGATWDHSIGESGVATDIRLTDGRTIGSDAVVGVLNRLTQAPPALVGALTVGDREYGFAELSALLLSWLAGFTGPILNPPTTRGLGGAWRSASEWACLAAEAGLDCVPVTADSDMVEPGAGRGARGWLEWPPHAAIAEDAIVLGDTVFSARRLDASVCNACRRLAVLADTPLLGLAFDESSRRDRPQLRWATPLPDLRAGGRPLIAALASALLDDSHELDPRNRVS